MGLPQASPSAAVALAGDEAKSFSATSTHWGCSGECGVSGVIWAAASGLGFGLFQALNVRAVRQLDDIYCRPFSSW